MEQLRGPREEQTAKSSSALLCAVSVMSFMAGISRFLAIGHSTLQLECVLTDSFHSWYESDDVWIELHDICHLNVFVTRNQLEEPSRRARNRRGLLLQNKTFSFL